MEKSQHKFDDLFDDQKFLDVLQGAEKLELVSFISKLPIPIAIIENEGIFLGINQNFADIYESDALYLMGKKLSSVSTVVHAYYIEALNDFKSQSHLQLVENEFYSKGHFYILNFKSLRDVDRKLIAVIVVCTDVTRLKRRERVLIQNNQKLHDHLYIDQTTGVNNRRALERFLKQNFVGTKRENYSFLKIDLDDFKKFNQLNSYTYGDELLTSIAQLFHDEIAQDNAILYRLNSASFVVVLEKCTPWSALTVAERLRHKMMKENIRFEADSEEILTISIGIYHPQAHNNFNELDIIEQIDIAVQQAKSQGKNSIFVLD
ncbi:GGDEF domain-containing protein [Acinetobacter shaoyimingii]|uniref:diguanylate cyclase n=1 Tax=Acinetobacter shaoyimingii TaxID=2715164 RepID=A0A6G8RXG4_9GAMM|nr:sensor domain-containing diguanylate cyclase [Acinetobacter shaoyimingii]QIO06619.1 diguanylate cyclase [Acinetobacter shaoyimingii]